MSDRSERSEAGSPRLPQTGTLEQKGHNVNCNYSLYKGPASLAALSAPQSRV
jgi:hypothetical protein